MNRANKAILSFRSLFGTSDEQMMWRVATQDDSHAFGELVKRWEGAIQRLCTRMTGDAHKAQDITQEVFARLFANRHRYEPGGKFSTYLWRIAINLSYDDLRWRKRRAEVPLDPEEGEDSGSSIPGIADQLSPDNEAVIQERAEAVRKALRRLPENYRTVIVLRHYEDLKFREIAEVLEIPEGTVKSRMAEGLTLLGRMLKTTLNGTLDASPKLQAGTRRKDQPEHLLI